MEHAKARPFVRFLRRLVRVSAYAYPLALLALCIAFVSIGERHWLTAGLLYAPRPLFALPLVAVLPALWFIGARKLLWTQLASLLLILFPLMGLVLPWPAGTPRGPTLKLLSLNVNSAAVGAERLLALVDELGPDLVLFQEAPWSGALHDGLRQRFAHFDASTQFLLASRYPILERTEPSSIAIDGEQRSPRFMRYVLDSNLGKLAAYNLHPISPRGSFGVSSLRGARHQFRKSSLWENEFGAELAHNAALREAQVAAVQAMASRETSPVLLAGDTNLPGTSGALHRHLAGYRDGFRSANWGFGYTFPASRPFLRLDRVLVSPTLDFAEFQLGCRGVSDHLCVVARLFRP